MRIIKNGVEVNETKSNNPFLYNYNENSEEPFEVSNFGSYSKSKSEGKIGYYFSESLSGRHLRRISNLIVTIDKQILSKTNHSRFEGSILLSDGNMIKFSDMKPEHLASTSKLNTYLINLCGTTIDIIEEPKIFLKAVIADNKKIKKIEEVEFGFSEDLNEYFTHDLTIRKDGFVNNVNPIFNEYKNDKNKLCFGVSTIEELEELKQRIIDDYIPLDDLHKTSTTLAFSLMPIVFPFVEDTIEKKPYLMLKGSSGSGKSLLSETNQRFYGVFKNLTSWSSTSTAITIIGSKFKDCAFMVDDFKANNLFNESDVNRISAIIQNYSDNTSRSRASGAVNIQEETIIKGIMIISAEDMFIREASTVARGIIIDMEQKEPDSAKVTKIINLSNHFNKVTPHFIKHIMNLSEIINLNKKAEEIIKKLENYSLENGLRGANLSRVQKNFALLLLANELVFEFLFMNKSKDQRDELLKKYEEQFYKLLKTNFERIQIFNPENKFKNVIWELIENEFLHLHNVSISENSKPKSTVGYYLKDDKGRLKIVFNMNKAYRETNNYLRNQGGIGITQDNLLTRLYQNKEISSSSSNSSIHFKNGIKQRGVEWLGSYPQNLF